MNFIAVNTLTLSVISPMGSAAFTIIETTHLMTLITATSKTCQVSHKQRKKWYCSKHWNSS